MTGDIQIVWLVEKLETVQVYYALDFEGLRDKRNSNEREIYLVCYMAPSEYLHVLHG